MAKVEVAGFQALTDKLKIKLPKILADMAFNADANVAGMARIKEQQQAHNLTMGATQRTSHNGHTVIRKFSEKDPKVGWVSTTRGAGNGESNFRMSNFSWESTRQTIAQKNAVEAGYTNQLANLWHRDVRYSKRSPWVGRAGGPYNQYQKGDVRKKRYQWENVPIIMNSVVGKAISKTETKFAKMLED